MRQHLTGWDIAGYVRFQRQTHKGTILLVEGEKDARVFDRLLDQKYVVTEVSFGKANALEALDLLEDEAFEGVVALVDADFDHLEEIKLDLEKLIVTDDHDLDITIIRTQALDLYLAEFADKRKLKAARSMLKMELLEALLGSSILLAYCRWASWKYGLMIDFKRLDFWQFIDQQRLECDEAALVRYLVSRSPAAGCTEEELRRRVLVLRSEEHSAFDLCNGHDASSVLGIALQDVIGSYRPIQVSARIVESSLRLAFDRAAFEQTSVYENFRRWQTVNAPYRLL